MFTGIIEDLGVVAEVISGEKSSIWIKSPLLVSDVAIGDSVAVNGVCLTVDEIAAASLKFDVMKPTLQDSSLQQLAAGDSVNLERAATLQTRLGGHLVSGHVDCVGKIVEIVTEKDLYLLQIEYPATFAKYIIPKGSVAIDGISLTVQQKVDSTKFTVGIIPHTLKQTTLNGAKAGRLVNLEFDMFAKYVENILIDQKETSANRLKKYLQG